MKSLIIVVIVMSLFLIVLTSPPNPGPDAAGSSPLKSISWMNTDGSRGIATEITVEFGPPRKDRYWVNPDGASGAVAETDFGRSLARRYNWMNPDGFEGLFNTAFDDRQTSRAIAVAVRN